MWEKDVKERYKALAAVIGGIASYNVGRRMIDSNGKV